LKGRRRLEKDGSNGKRNRRSKQQNEEYNKLGAWANQDLGEEERKPLTVKKTLVRTKRMQEKRKSYQGRAQCDFKGGGGNHKIRRE